MTNLEREKRELIEKIEGKRVMVLTREQVVENISRLQMHYAYPISFATDLLAHDAALRAINAELLEALRALYDEQNDAPLERNRNSWEDAMRLAQKVLAKAEGR